MLPTDNLNTFVNLSKLWKYQITCNSFIASVE